MKIKRKVSGIFWRNLTGKKSSIIEVTKKESDTIDNAPTTEVMLLLTGIYTRNMKKI